MFKLVVTVVIKYIVVVVVVFVVAVVVVRLFVIYVVGVRHAAILSPCRLPFAFVFALGFAYIQNT